MFTHASGNSASIKTSVLMHPRSVTILLRSLLKAPRLPALLVVLSLITLLVVFIAHSAPLLVWGFNSKNTTPFSPESTSTQSFFNSSSPVTTALCTKASKLPPLLTTLPPSTPPSLQRYAVWHRTARACLITRSATACRVTGGAPPPLLVWRCPQDNDVTRCAGLGDRLRGIQFALAVAVATRRLFLIDWPTAPFALSAVLSPAALDWTIPLLPSSSSQLRKKRNTNSGMELLRQRLLLQPHVESSLAILHWFACEPPRRCRRGHHVADERDLPAPQLSADYIRNDPNASVVRAARESSEIDIETANVAAQLAPFTNLVIETRMEPEMLGLFLRNNHTAHILPDLVPRLSSSTFSHENNDSSASNGTSGSYLLHTRRALLRVLFRPSPALAQRLRDVTSDMNKTADGAVHARHASFIGVHARTGADFGETGDRRFQAINERLGAGVSALLACARHAHQQQLVEQLNLRSLSGSVIEQNPSAGEELQSDEGKQVFIAADSRQLKTEFSESATREGWDVSTVQQNKTFHLGVNTETVSKLDEAAQCAAYVNVFADVLMLARATTIVTTGSGFADAAFVLGRARRIYLTRLPRAEGENASCSMQEEDPHFDK